MSDSPSLGGRGLLHLPGLLTGLLGAKLSLALDELLLPALMLAQLVLAKLSLAHLVLPELMRAELLLTYLVLSELVLAQFVFTSLELEKSFLLLEAGFAGCFAVKRSISEGIEGAAGAHGSFRDGMQ